MKVILIYFPVLSFSSQTEEYLVNYLLQVGSLRLFCFVYAYVPKWAASMDISETLSFATENWADDPGSTILIYIGLFKL